jgi:hypothetical protein
MSRGPARRQHKLAAVSDTGPRPSPFTRRRLAVAVAVAIATLYMVIAWRIDERTLPCATVHHLLDFNRSSQASLKAKTHFAAAGSYGDEDRFPTDADYQAWIDGMRRYADRVSAPGLSEHAQKAAALVARWPAIKARFAAQSEQQKPGDSIVNVPAAKEFADLNRGFNEEFAALERACPGR